MYLPQMQHPSFFRNLLPFPHINPLSPTSDQNRISPYNIELKSNRQMLRIKENINDGTSN